MSRRRKKRGNRPQTPQSAQQARSKKNAPKAPSTRPRSEDEDSEPEAPRRIETKPSHRSKRRTATPATKSSTPPVAPQETEPKAALAQDPESTPPSESPAPPRRVPLRERRRRAAAAAAAAEPTQPAPSTEPKREPAPQRESSAAPKRRERAPERRAAAPQAAMRESTPAPEPELTSPRIDKLIEGLILLLLLYLPLHFGGVLPYSQVVLIGVATVVTALFALRCFMEDQAPVVWTWAYLPAAFFVALVVLQVTPLPMGVLEVIAPYSAQVWTDAFTDPAWPRSDGSVGAPTWATISLYPFGTWTDLRTLLAIAAIFFVSVNIYRDRWALRRLLAGVGLIGLTVATIGITQLLLGADKIYWYFESPAHVLTAGPFASYSHYSEFINLAMGCAIGYLLVRATDRSMGRSIELRDVVDLRGSHSTRLDQVLAVFLIVGAVAIALSTSRNGLISMVFAAGVTGLALQATRKVDGIGWPMVGMAAIAFVSLLALGFDPIYERMSTTVEEPVEALQARLDIARDSLAMAAAQPITGTGFGSFWVTFPSFDEALRAGTAEHAENQYVEFLAETGGAGLLAVLAVLAFGVAAMIRSMRSRRRSLNFAAFGLAYGVSAMAFHSTTDFGLEIPAVGLLASILVAGALARGGKVLQPKGGAGFMLGAASTMLVVGLATTLSPAWASAKAHRAIEFRNALHQEMPAPAYRGTPEKHALLAEVTEQAFAATPGDVEVAYWRVYHEWTNAVAAALEYGEPQDAISPETNPELVALANDVMGALVSLREIAPTYGPAWSVAGQIGLLWSEIEDAPAWITKGRELAPHNPATCTASALLHLSDDNEEAGLEDLQRAIRVGASPRAMIDLLASQAILQPELAYELAAGDLALMLRLQQSLSRAGADESYNRRIASEIDALIEREATRSGAPPWMLVQLARLRERQGEGEAAIGVYRRLLALDPDNTARYDLARILADRGELNEARRQLRDLLSVVPNHGGARRLLSRLERQ